MVLQKTLIDIPLGGLDQKAATKLLPPGKMLELENVEFDKDGSINKRAGLASLYTSKMAYKSMFDINGNIYGFTQYGDLERILKNSSSSDYFKGFVYQPLTIVDRRPTTYFASATIKSLSMSSYGSQSIIVMSTGSSSLPSDGVAIYSYSNNDFSLIDFENGEDCYQSKPIASCVSGKYLYIVYNHATAGLYYTVIDVTTTFSNSSPIQVEASGLYNFDITPVGALGNCVLTYYATTVETATKAIIITPTAVSGSAVTNSGVAADAGGHVGIGTDIDSGTTAVVAYSYTDSGLKKPSIWKLTYSDTGPSLTEATAGAMITGSTGVNGSISRFSVSPRRSGYVNIALDYTTTSSSGMTAMYVNLSTGTIGRSKSLAGMQCLSCVIHGGTFTERSGASGTIDNIWVTPISLSQGSAILATINLEAEEAPEQQATAKTLSGLVANNAYGQILSLPAKAKHSSNEFSIACELVGDYDQLTSTYKKNSAVIYASRKNKLYGTTLRGGTFVSTGGSVLRLGPLGAEHVGFIAAPAKPTLSQSSTGGSLSNGTYTVVIVARGLDGNGNKKISQVSEPASITLTGGTSTQKITISTIYPNGSQVDLGYPDSFSIDSFCTEAGGTILYKAGTATSITSVSSSSEVLYTTGGYLEHSYPSGAMDVVARGDRLYAINSAGEVYYTHSLLDGEEPAFSDFLKFNAIIDNGTEFRMAQMDGRLIIFGENSIQVVSGSGPDTTGANNDLSKPEVIQSDYGRKAGTDIFYTGDGIIYQTKNGLYLLDRSLSSQKVSSAIDDFDAGTITDIVQVPDSKMLIFNRGDGLAVLDRDTGRWATHTITATCVAKIGNDICYSVGTNILKRSTTTFTDDGTAYSMKITTPWIHLNGIQGYQRIYNVLVNATWKSACNMVLDFYYDYNETSAETITVDLSTGYSVGDLVQYRHNAGRRCQAMKIRIKDTSSTGASFTLDGISMEVGIKSGAYKLGSTRTV